MIMASSLVRCTHGPFVVEINTVQFISKNKYCKDIVITLKPSKNDCIFGG